MLIIVGILLIFGLVIRQKWKNGAAKKEEVLKLVAVTSEEEAVIAKLQAIEEYNSPPQLPQQLEKHYNCVVCHCPTTTRCSRCKAVRYCSGKCQINHWRQGHKNDCQPVTATPLHASKISGHVTETASENHFFTHLNGEPKIDSDPNPEIDDSKSSHSSTSHLFSSTEQSDTSFDTSTSSVVELGIPTSPDKALASGINPHIPQTISNSDKSDVLCPPSPVYSANDPHLVKKIEKSPTTKSYKNFNGTKFSERIGGEASLFEEVDVIGIKSRSSESSRSVRTSSAESWANQEQFSNSKVRRSLCHNNPNVDLSSQSLESMKTSPTDGCQKNESQFREGNESGPMPSQSTGGLKTSVRKFVHHFRTPKQSKSQMYDTVKDSGGNYNHKVIFPPKLFMQLYSCDDVVLHPFGLVNCGNSCYANAVLQCLTFTRPIACYLLQGLHSKTCWKRDCFICKFEHMIRKGQETSSPLSPLGLVSQIQPVGREEDAHEFLRNVVDKMQSTCLEKAGISGSLAEDSTLMGLTFGGYLQSKIKCMKCSGRSELCERMMDLNVEIDGNIYTLEEALAQFTTSETLGGDDKYKCSRCKSYERAKKKLTILEAPNILTIVLKRFQSGTFQKLNKPVRFPELLNIAPFMSGMSDSSSTYHLYAVVVHLGTMNAASSGHYISYVKDFRGDWFRVDDSRVNHVDLETVLSVEAYILFYARHTPRGESFIRNSTAHCDGKTKRNMEAISSSNSGKKKNSKTKPSPCGRDAKHPDWMSPNDFTVQHRIDPAGWEFQPRHRIPMGDSSSDSSSIFSTSDAGSYSTDSTKDSNTDDISGYIFGSSWYPP